MFRIVILFILSLSSSLFSKTKIGEYPFYFVDSAGDKTIEQVTQQEFIQSEKATPSWGWTNDIIWVKVDYQKTSNETQILEIGYPLLDNVEIYTFKDGIKIKESRAGDSVPNSEDIVDEIEPAMTIPEEAGLYEFYFRIETSSSTQAPLNLYTEQEFQDKEKEDFLVMGLYSGIMTIMGIYNIFLFFSTRHLAYLFYSSFVLVFLLLQTALSGYGYHYLWPAAPVISDYIIAQGGLVATALMVLFANSFLRFQENKIQRITRDILLGFLGFSLFTTLIVSYGSAVKIMAIASILTVPTIFVLAIYQAVVEQQRAAKLYCLAWTFFIGACVVYILKQLGILPVNWFTNYSFKIGSIVEVSLLSFALADRLNQLKQHLSILNNSLESKVEEQTRDIRSILKNLPQAVFQIIDKDGLVIGSEYSSLLEEFVNQQQLGGRNPIATVFANSDLPPDQLDQLATHLLVSFGEDRFQWEVNSHMLPHEFHLNGRLIEADWNIVTDSNDLIAKILCVLNDVSELRKLQEENLLKAESALLIKEIMEQNRKRISHFLDMAEEYVTKCFEDQEDLKLIFRNLHTLKGLARGYSLSKLVDGIHSAETLVQSLISHSSDRGRNRDKDELNETLRTLNNVVSEYRKTFTKLFSKHTDDIIEVEEKKMRNIYSNLESNFNDAKKNLLFLREDNLQNVLVDEVNSLASISEKLGKPGPKITFVDDVNVIPNELKRPLKHAFVHLFRNSIDHGIEAAEDRILASKPEVGNIKISCFKHIDSMDIHVSDDGRGIDLKKIEDRARELDLKHDSSPEGIASMIFQFGLSTAQNVSEISGRGVGLDAVQESLKKIGATISISLLDDGSEGHLVPFEFIISVPMKKVLTSIAG